METITSIKDPRIRAARMLTSSTGRRTEGKCLLEGPQAITWALDAQAQVSEVFWAAHYQNDELKARLEKANIPLFLVSEGIAKKISDTSYLVPVIGTAITPHEVESLSAMGTFVLVLDQVKDQGNIGAIFRSAAAFGITTVAFTHEDADPYFKKTIDSSRGTVFTTQIKRYNGVKNTVSHLKKSYQIIATSPHGTKLQSLAPLQKKPVALVLGNETSGVSDELLKQADIVVQMPMNPSVESLNVAVFAGLSMYELKLRMILTMLTSFIQKALGRQVNVAGHLIRTVFHQALQKVTDLSAQQVILLMIMTVDGTMTRSQIEKDTGATKEKLDQLLDPLLSQGLLRQDDTVFSITHSGKETIVKLWPLIEALEQNILHGFSEKDKRDLNDYLERIQANCTQLLSENNSNVS